MTTTRTETDSLGPIEVESANYFGAQTERARRNFPVSGLAFPHRFVAAHALIKREAAKVNLQLGLVPQEIADAIVAAADEVIAGRFPQDFPLDIFQTGSGTSTNMNVNEVISNRAIEILGGTLGSKKPVHPNDHVNASQSSNDSIPTSIHVSAYLAIVEDLEPALREAARLAGAARPRSSTRVVKIGRTHLQDAVPVRLGQEFGGYAQQIRERPRPPRLGQAAARRAGPRRHRGRHRPQRPAGLLRAGDRRHRRGHRPAPSARPPTSSRRWPPKTPRSRPRAPCAPSRCRSPRSPTTSAGWARARAAASARSTCRACSPAPRSCPARSTR